MGRPSSNQSLEKRRGHWLITMKTGALGMSKIFRATVRRPSPTPPPFKGETESKDACSKVQRKPEFPSAFEALALCLGLNCVQSLFPPAI